MEGGRLASDVHCRLSSKEEAASQEGGSHCQRRRLIWKPSTEKQPVAAGEAEAALGGALMQMHQQAGSTEALGTSGHCVWQVKTGGGVFP